MGAGEGEPVRLVQTMNFQHIMKMKSTFASVGIAVGWVMLGGGASVVRAQSASAGLWVGTVSLNSVQDPQGALTPSGGTFQFRILYHVNTAGEVRLLRDVVVMQRDHDNDAATAPVIALVTDLTQLPRYTGIVRRSDGRRTGIRYAATAYDFTGNELLVQGKLELEKTLDYRLEAGENGATNPFRHKYHPEHEKGRAYTRVVTVNFKGGTQAPTSTGVTRITGTYKETITGVVTSDLNIAGSIELDRVSTATALNP